MSNCVWERDGFPWRVLPRHWDADSVGSSTHASAACCPESSHRVLDNETHLNDLKKCKPALEPHFQFPPICFEEHISTTIIVLFYMFNNLVINFLNGYCNPWCHGTGRTGKTWGSGQYFVVQKISRKHEKLACMIIFSFWPSILYDTYNDSDTGLLHLQAVTFSINI